MSHLTVCDGCGQDLHWSYLTMEKRGEQEFGGQANDEHFCGWACVLIQAEKKTRGSKDGEATVQ